MEAYARGGMDARSSNAGSVDVNGFRVARFKRFMELLDRVSGKGETVRILDIGGTVAYWNGLRDLWSRYPVEITLLNYGSVDGSEEGFTIVGGDARRTNFGDNAFDIVHSNSVIEHVGDWQSIQSMASEVRRLAPNYFLQTPNYWFPIEPHFRTAFFQFFPKPLRAMWLRTSRLGFRDRARSYDEALETVGSVELLSSRQMRKLFPDATIEKERFFGLTKSLIAIK